MLLPCAGFPWVHGATLCSYRCSRGTGAGLGCPPIVPEHIFVRSGVGLPFSGGAGGRCSMHRLSAGVASQEEISRYLHASRDVAGFHLLGYRLFPAWNVSLELCCAIACSAFRVPSILILRCLAIQLSNGCVPDLFCRGGGEVYSCRSPYKLIRVHEHIDTSPAFCMLLRHSFLLQLEYGHESRPKQSHCSSWNA